MIEEATAVFAKEASKGLIILAVRHEAAVDARDWAEARRLARFLARAATYAVEGAERMQRQAND